MERELFALLIDAVDRLAEARHRPAKAQFTDRDIILVWLWALLHDRPIDWACRRLNWPWHDRTRRLPSGSTMSRRLRSEPVQKLMIATLRALRVPSAERPDLFILDAKPLPVSGHSEDRDVGFGRASRVMARGYKLHSITDMAGNQWVFDVLSLQVNEVAAAKELLVRLPMLVGATMLADGNYDCNVLYDLAAERGVQLVAASRRKHATGLGHHRHSPYRLKAIKIRTDQPNVFEPRRRIESHFGTMGNVIGGLSPLPNHIRGLNRVRRWVTGKIIIDAAHRLRRRQIRAA